MPGPISARRRSGAAAAALAVSAAALGLAACRSSAQAAGPTAAAAARIPAADGVSAAPAESRAPVQGAAGPVPAADAATTAVLTASERAFCIDWSTPAGLIGQPARFWTRLADEAPAPLKADVVEIARDTAAGSPYAGELVTPASAVFDWTGANCPQ